MIVSSRRLWTALDGVGKVRRIVLDEDGWFEGSWKMGVIREEEKWVKVDGGRMRLIDHRSTSGVGRSEGQEEELEGCVENLKEFRGFFQFPKKNLRKTRDCR
jgi:hypothetical protein